MASSKLPTGKSLGLAKGDYCVNTSNGWPCVIVSDVHTFAPCCRVYGFHEELGSVYATELKKIDKGVFDKLVEAQRACGNAR